MKRSFYVYALCDPRKSGEYVYGDIVFYEKPFYIGKGIRDRATTHFRECEKKNSKKNSKIKKIKQIGKKPSVIYIYKNISENEAYILEKEIIEKIGIKNLTNICSGGLGRDSESMIGEKNPMFGKKRPRWLIDKMQKARLLTNGINKGKTLEEILGEEKAKITKEKMSKKRKGKSYDEFYGKEKSFLLRKNQSIRRKQYRHSDETKKKMAISNSIPNVVKKRVESILKHRELKFNKILFDKGDKIIELHNIGLSVFNISNKVGVSRYLCKKIIYTKIKSNLK